MGKILKKGTKGAAVNYITRQQALKALQISLADFRRLCILKGIYPREPKNRRKANKGSSALTTFYYTKDIKYIMHEPLLVKFREYKQFARKLTKFLYKGQYSTAKSLEENHKPIFTLDHLVKERYPSFVDALRDLDDALSMIFLFARIPADSPEKAKVATECQRLCDEFMAYVIHTKSLRKVFFSIKGIYYQAEIKGQTITWVTPYQFAQEVPTDVDFRVMHTFLDFYQTLIGFINYRLFSELNVTYPPKLDISLSIVGANSAEGAEEDNEEVTAGIDEFKSVKSKDDKAQEKEDQEEMDELDKITDASSEANAISRLFSKHTVFISRESPLKTMLFLVRSCGGKVSWDPSVAVNPPLAESDERITCQISDRPKVSNRILSRFYIQPQWVADCINTRKILKSTLYEPGQILPPHLSPFVVAKEGDYVPSAGLESEEEEEDLPVEDTEENEEDDNAQYERELQAEAAGVTFSEYQAAPKTAGKAGAVENRATKQKRTADEIDEEDRKVLAESMLSNKQRRLYSKMKLSNRRKAKETAVLEQKKKAIDERKKEQAK